VKAADVERSRPKHRRSATQRASPRQGSRPIPDSAARLR
jgi:hypothetical protein